MKQGSGNSRMGSTKTEPRSMAINPAGVADIGIQQIRTIPQPVHMGRGFGAPKPAECTVHKGGSQGRHK